MSDSRNNAFPFDWKAFENMFGGRFMLPDLSQIDLRDTSWITNYIGEILKNVNPMQNNSAPSSRLNAEIFQTHKSVIVRIPVPQDIDEASIRLSINKLRLRVEGLPTAKSQHTLTLPVPVIVGSSRAVIRDGVLEIRMPKDPNDRKFTKLYVQL